MRSSHANPKLTTKVHQRWHGHGAINRIEMHFHHVVGVVDIEKPNRNMECIGRSVVVNQLADVLHCIEHVIMHELIGLFTFVHCFPSEPIRLMTFVR